MDVFQVAATGHSVNYLPEYIAAKQGFFAAEGLEVKAIVPNPWDLVLDEIEQSRSHVALGGVWVPAMFHGKGKHLIPFAKVSARCPMVIVGRKPEPIDLADLAHSTVLVPGGNGASPGMFLELLLAEQGVRQDQVKFVQNLSGSMLAQLFAGGLGDYLLIDPVSAKRLQRAGKGYVVSPLAVSGGAIPWSVYYSAAGTMGDDPALQERFYRALEKGMDYILTHPAHDMADFLQAHFPKIPLEDCIALIEDYKSWGMWDHAGIEEASYTRWQTGMLHTHLIDKPVPYADLIDTRIQAACKR